MRTNNLVQSFQVFEKEGVDKICAVGGLLIIINRERKGGGGRGYGRFGVVV